MRLVLAMVLAGLVALPLSASAQGGEEGTTAEPNLQEPTPPAEPASEEPGLQLKLDDAGVRVAPGYPPRTADGYTLEEMEVRVRRAKGGCAAMGGVVALGVGLVIGGVVYEPRGLSDVAVQPGLLTMGIIVTSSGAAGMSLVCNRLAARKKQLRTLREAHYGQPRRVQWDLAQSRLVF